MLAAELSENKLYFEGSPMGALGIRAYIDIEEGRLSEAKKLKKNFRNRQ